MKIVAAICIGFVVGLLSFVTVPAQEIPKEIKGGILNGKATNLPSPEYPAEAKAAGVEGTVLVEVVIDESGTVISAAAVPEVVKTRAAGGVGERDSAAAETLLRQAAEKAAQGARFPPTLLNGIPVKVSGTVVYHFMLDESKTRPVNGGVITGKATTLPKPEYPAAARAVRAGGTVVVHVIVDENGDVTAAAAVSGHPLLRAAAVEAAKAAKFAPTCLAGECVKVSGMVVYNFVPPKKEETN